MLFSANSILKRRIYI